MCVFVCVIRAEAFYCFRRARVETGAVPMWLLCDFTVDPFAPVHLQKFRGTFVKNAPPFQFKSILARGRTDI